jgi:diketogulonate reductase-like aldo/keto reductase
MTSVPSVSTATLPLLGGTTIPIVGLGVYQSRPGATTQEAVLTALRVGYRHIDTARIYRNESDVGKALRESDVPRDQVFVTTKLWNDDQGYDSALRAFDESLQRLGLDHVDLYLLHWPVAHKRLDSWRALERIASEGRARAIGVSNFLVPHLEELLGRAQRKPDVNQRRDTTALCAREGIIVEAYSPLTRGARLGHPVVVEIARRLGKSPAQVLLRWGVQHGFVVLPKSTREERIRENAALFDWALDAGDMAKLDGLEEGLTTGWDPASQP